MPCLSQQTLRRLLTLAALTLLSATLALAQDVQQPAKRESAEQAPGNWSDAATLSSSQKNLFVVTTAAPTHPHTCRVQSITTDQLICKAAFGASHIYQSQDIAALLIPAKYKFKFKPHFDTADKIGLGAAILGGIAMTGLGAPLVAAGVLGLVVACTLTDAVLITPDRLLYLAPGQTLQVKIHHPPTR